MGHAGQTKYDGRPMASAFVFSNAGALYVLSPHPSAAADAKISSQLCKDWGGHLEKIQEKILKYDENF